MARIGDAYVMRTVQEDDIGTISREVYESFNSVSYTLSQLSLSRQVIDDWIRFEFETEHKRNHCSVIIHEPTDCICGVFVHKSYSTTMLSLPKELAPIAPRYYLLQETHSKVTNQLGLDPARVVYGDFGFITENHRGHKSSILADKHLVQRFEAMGYTGRIGEVSHPFLVKVVKANGRQIIGEVNAANFVLGHTRPFTKDVILTVFYHPFATKPRL